MATGMYYEDFIVGETVEHPLRPDQVGDRVRQPLLRVGVERADQRQVRLLGRYPAYERRDRLMQMGYVVTAGPQLPGELCDADG